MNCPAFEYVVAKELYNVEGLEKAFRRAVQEKDFTVVNFPAEAREVKAMWARITDTDKPRYHWAQYQETPEEGGQLEIWGLTALHINTHELPNWVWMTFEHVDAEANADETSRDSATTNTDGVRSELKDSKWQF